MAFIPEIQYDAEGNHLNTNFTDYLVPTSLETPHWETANTVTPSPHHPMGAKGVRREPERRQPGGVLTMPSRRAVAAGVRHIDMPMSRSKVWRAIRDARRCVNLQYSARRRSRPASRRSGVCHQPRESAAQLPDVVDVTVQDPTHLPKRW